MEYSPVEAILFDLGGTLRRTTKRDEQGKRERVQQIQALIGSDLPAEQFVRLLTDRYQAYRRWAEKSMIELDEAHLWTHWMAPEVSLDRITGLAPFLNRIWRDAIGIREVYPETIPVVQELHRRSYPLGIVSNTISQTEIPLALEAAGLSRYFKVMVLSSVFGKRKPDPAILLEAAKMLAVPPAHCAYIGNRLDRDVAGARRAGFSMVMIIHHGHGTDPQSFDPAMQPDHIIHNLREILDYFPAK